jgi:hypothetical protein
MIWKIVITAMLAVGTWLCFQMPYEVGMPQLGAMLGFTILVQLWK